MAWKDLAKAFTTPPQQRYAEAREQQIAKGRLQRCPGCGTVSAPTLVCPVCLTAADGTPPAEKQLVRVYRSGDVGKAFEQEAALMARAGWRVQDQAYGGLQSTMSAGAGALLGVAAARKPKELTVTYVRD